MVAQYKPPAPPDHSLPDPMQAAGDDATYRPSSRRSRQYLVAFFGDFYAFLAL